MKVIIVVLLCIVYVGIKLKQKIKELSFDGGTYDDWYDEDEDTGIDGIKDFKDNNK
jgi:hypothetical protein